LANNKINGFEWSIQNQTKRLSLPVITNEIIPPVGIKERSMEKIINIHVEKLPEGVFLATSEDIPGLVAQGRTVTESLEIARDVARKLLEARAERSGVLKLTEISDSFDYPLIVTA
jgi:predicted RNase H-like HicB family nuclease